MTQPLSLLPTLLLYIQLDQFQLSANSSSGQLNQLMKSAPPIKLSALTKYHTTLNQLFELSSNKLKKLNNLVHDHKIDKQFLPDPFSQPIQSIF